MTSRALTRPAARRLGVAALAVAAAAFAGCTTTMPSDGASAAAARQSLNAQADAALSKLYDAVPGSRETVARAAGVLVCPAVVGGSLTIGVESGRCVLREPGRAAEYYRTTALSFGLQAGAQSRAMYYVFTAKDALDQFRASNGWTAGAEATVAVASAGVNAAVDTNTVKQPVIGYVLTNAGLEAGVSMSGTKFTKIDG